MDFVEEKKEVVKTTVDCEKELLKEATALAKKIGHTKRQIFEGGLRQYIHINKDKVKSGKKSNK